MRIQPFYILLTVAILLFHTTVSAQFVLRDIEVQEFEAEITIEELVLEEEYIIDARMDEEEAEIVPVEAVGAATDGGIQIRIPWSMRFVYLNPLDELYERDPRTGILRLPAHRLHSEPLHGLSFRDTVFVNPLFLPVVFDGQILPRNFSFTTGRPSTENRGVLLSPQQTFAPRLQQIDFAQNVRRQFYATHATHINLTTDDLPDPIPSTDEVLEQLSPFRNLSVSLHSIDLSNRPDVTGATIERGYWQRRGEHRFTFSQNFFSDNWHRRSNSNMVLDSHQRLFLDHRKDRVHFTNVLDWRLVLQTTPDDTLRRHSISNDRLQYTGRFRIDASPDDGRWSYSASLDASTQTLNNFPPNSMDIRSAFLSPLIVTPSIGMTYRFRRNPDPMWPTWPGRARDWHRTTLEVALNPFSPRFVFVRHPDVDVRREQIPEGRRHNIDWRASSVDVNFRFFFTRHIDYRTRFNYWTDYSRILIDWENFLEMRLTNALTVNFNFALRFDDAAQRDDRFGLLQVNQSLRIGFIYNWPSHGVRLNMN